MALSATKVRDCYAEQNTGIRKAIFKIDPGAGAYPAGGFDLGGNAAIQQAFPSRVYGGRVISVDGGLAVAAQAALMGSMLTNAASTCVTTGLKLKLITTAGADAVVADASTYKFVLELTGE